MQVYMANKGSDLSQEMNYDATPQILCYGLLNLANVDEKSESLRLNTFYIMPLYEMNLKQNLSKLDGVRKIEKIIDVTNI